MVRKERSNGGASWFEEAICIYWLEANKTEELNDLNFEPHRTDRRVRVALQHAPCFAFFRLVTNRISRNSNHSFPF